MVGDGESFNGLPARLLTRLNHEICCCDFTRMLVTDGLDLEPNTAPLCGAI